MRVTVLMDNERLEDRTDLKAELGLSLLVEHGGQRVLFDTGASGAFADNAAALGVDLGRVDAAVVSHHHYDHAGGLGRFFDENRHAPVYLRRAAYRHRFFKVFGLMKKPIGADPVLLDRFADRLIEVDDTREIVPGFVLITQMGHDHPRPAGNRYLWEAAADGPRRDLFDHELSMVVHHDRGMVVFTGCSHNGVLNMVDGAMACFPDRPVTAVVGGFHLVGLPFLNSIAGTRQDVEALGRTLGEISQATIVTGHCTGRKATGILSDILGDRLRPLAAGRVLEL